MKEGKKEGMKEGRKEGRKVLEGSRRLSKVLVGSGRF